MKFVKAALPHLAISLNIALLIVIYLDRRNPMMGFLVGAPFAVLSAAACIASIATAVMLCSARGVKTPEKQNIK